METADFYAFILLLGIVLIIWWGGVYLFGAFLLIIKKAAEWLFENIKRTFLLNLLNKLSDLSNKPKNQKLLQRIKESEILHIVIGWIVIILLLSIWDVLFRPSY
jgi:hypothetical protein